MNIKTITILITDGESSDDVRMASSLLRQKSSVIAVGVTPNADRRQLAQMASHPLTRSLITLQSFGDLAAVEDTLIDSLCTLRYIKQNF